jgi:hypothetical protein
LKAHSLSPDDVEKSPASAYQPAFPQLKSITWLIGSTSTIALDNIYRAQNRLKYCARQLVSAANVSTGILFPLRRIRLEASRSKYRWLNSCGGDARRMILQRNDCRKLIRNFLFAI